MTPTDPSPRAVRVVAAGGTIAMRGERAVPALDAAELVDQLPQVAGFRLQAETVLSLPSTHLTLSDALDLARRAGAAAAGGEGVVLTTGTDTMEEVAVLCGLTYGGDAPIVITGANRPGSAPGADGPANLLDAIILARAPAAEGLGVVVAFGGEVHAAMTVRKIDSTGPVAFGSPTTGPIGRIVEGRVWLHATPRRPTPLPVRRLDHRVSTVTTGLGDDGAMLRHAVDVSDGVVLIALGAGHLSKEVLVELRGAVRACPRRHYLPPGPLVDAVRDLRLRGRRARPARERRDLRPVPVGGGGTDGAAGLSRRGPRPLRHRGRARAVRRALARSMRSDPVRG